MGANNHVHATNEETIAQVVSYTPGTGRTPGTMTVKDLQQHGDWNRITTTFPVIVDPHYVFNPENPVVIPDFQNDAVRIKHPVPVENYKNKNKVLGNLSLARQTQLTKLKTEGDTAAAALQAALAKSKLGPVKHVGPDWTEMVQPPDWTAAPVPHWITQEYAENAKGDKGLQEMALPASYMRIGHVALRRSVGPVTLTVEDTPQLQIVPALRHSTALKRMGGVNRKTVTFTVMFPSKEAILLELIPLIRQSRRAPFVPVINSGLFYDHDITALAIQAISVTTVPAFPESLEATIVAYPFPADRFMLDSDVFDSCINYPLLELWLTVTEGQTLSYYEAQNRGPKTPVWNGQISLATPDRNWLRRINENETSANKSAVQKYQATALKDPLILGAKALSTDKETRTDAIASIPLGDNESAAGSPVYKVSTVVAMNSDSSSVLSTSNGTFVAFEMTDEIARIAFLTPQDGGADYIVLTNNAFQVVATSETNATLTGAIVSNESRLAAEQNSQPGFSMYVGQSVAIWKQRGNATPLSTAATLKIKAKSADPNTPASQISLAQALLVADSNQNLDPAKPQFTDPVWLDGCTVTAVNAGMANYLAEISPSDAEIPEYQIMGSSDVAIEFSTQTTLHGVNIIRDVLYEISRLAVDFRGNADGTPAGGFCKLDNEIAQTMGITYAIPSKLRISSIPGIPDMFDVTLGFIQYDPTQRRIEAPSDFSNPPPSLHQNISAGPNTTEAISNFDNFVVRAQAYESLDKHISTIDLYPDIQPPLWTTLNKWITDLKVSPDEKDPTKGIWNEQTGTPNSGYENLVSWPYTRKWMAKNAQEFLAQASPYTPNAEQSNIPSGYTDPDFYCCGRGSSSRQSGRAFTEEVLKHLSDENSPLIMHGSDGAAGMLEFGKNTFTASNDQRTHVAFTAHNESASADGSQGAIKPVPKANQDLKQSPGPKSQRVTDGTPTQDSQPNQGAIDPSNPADASLFAAGVNNPEYFDKLTKPLVYKQTSLGQVGTALVAAEGDIFDPEKAAADLATMDPNPDRSSPYWTQQSIDELKLSAQKVGVPLVIAANLACTAKQDSNSGTTLYISKDNLTKYTNEAFKATKYVVPDQTTSQKDPKAFSPFDAKSLVALYYFNVLYKQGSGIIDSKGITSYTTQEKNLYAYQYAAAKSLYHDPAIDTTFKSNPEGFMSYLQNKYGHFSKTDSKNAFVYVNHVLKGITAKSFTPMTGGVSIPAQQIGVGNTVNQIVATAQKQISQDSSKYTTGNKLDGSALVNYVYQQAGNPLSANSVTAAAIQKQEGQIIPKTPSATLDTSHATNPAGYAAAMQPNPGDLLFYQEKDLNYCYVAIYMGNGNQIGPDKNKKIVETKVDMKNVAQVKRIVSNYYFGAPDMRSQGYEQVHDRVWDFDRASYDPENGEDIFYTLRRSDHTGRLLRAFPTYLILLINGGKWVGYYHMTDTFYGLHSPLDIQTYSSTLTPVDTCTISFADPYNNLSAQAQDVELGDFNQTLNTNRLKTSNSLKQNWAAIDDIWNGIVSLFMPNSDMELRREQELKSLLVKPGNRLHVRLGYGGNATTLPIVFNGVISGVEHQDDILSVVALGDGCELLSQLSSVNGDPQGAFYEQAGMAGAGMEVRNIILGLLSASENAFLAGVTDGEFAGRNPYGIEHFGDTRRCFFTDTTDIGINCYSGWGDQPINITLASEDAGILSFVPEAIDGTLNLGNVFQGMMEDRYTPTGDNFIDGMGMNKFYRCLMGEEMVGIRMENATPWAIFDSLRMACLDYVCSVEPFGLRSTLFFGKSWWPYHFRYDYQMLDKVTTSSSGINVNPGLLWFDQNPNAESLYRRRPMMQVHHCHSGYNLIASNIEATAEGWARSVQAIGSYAGNIFNGNSIETETSQVMFLDSNIFPEFQNMKLVQSGLYSTVQMREEENGANVVPAAGMAGGEAAGPFGVVGGVLAGLVGAALLQTNVLNNFAVGALHDEVRNMYNGNVYVIGNGWMRPRHFVHLIDEMKKMAGPVEIKEVTHTFSAQGGFITTWTPSVIGYAQDVQVQGVVGHAAMACARLYATKTYLRAMATARGSYLARRVIKGGVRFFANVDETISRAGGARLKNMEYHLSRIGRGLFDRTPVGKLITKKTIQFNTVGNMAMSRRDIIKAINTQFDNNPNLSIGKLRRTQQMVQSEDYEGILRSAQQAVLAKNRTRIGTNVVTAEEEKMLNERTQKIFDGLVKAMKPGTTVRANQNPSLLRWMGGLLEEDSTPSHLYRAGRSAVLNWLSDESRISTTLHRINRTVASKSVIGVYADCLEKLNADEANAIRTVIASEDFNDLGLGAKSQLLRAEFGKLIDANDKKITKLEGDIDAATDVEQKAKIDAAINDLKKKSANYTEIFDNLDKGIVNVDEFALYARGLGSDVAKIAQNAMIRKAEGKVGSGLLGPIMALTTLIIGQGLVNSINRYTASRHSLNLIPLHLCGREFSAGINGHLGVVVGDTLGPVDSLINSVYKLGGGFVPSVLGLTNPYENREPTVPNVYQ